MINTISISIFIVIITALINGVPEDLPENISARFTGGLLVSIVTWKKGKGFRELVSSVLSVPTNLTDNRFFLFFCFFCFFYLVICILHWRATFADNIYGKDDICLSDSWGFCEEQQVISSTVVFVQGSCRIKQKQ